MKIIDAKGRDIHVGDRVRFATWGMFDMFVADKEKSYRRPTDQKYITHVQFGTVEELVNEDTGSLHIRQDGASGVMHLCTKPSWGVRPEFVEIIEL